MESESGKKMERKKLSLYVHIPFCVKKCPYCDFLSAPASEETKEHYVNLLCEEIEREREAVCYRNYRGETVFFGGGTPTTLKQEQLEMILCKLKTCFFDHLTEKKESLPRKTKKEQAGVSSERELAMNSPEVTLECNPGTAAGEALRKLREAGFNRLSIGLQSAHNEELRRLGRIHTWEDFMETYHAARETGFQNINVDLMSALPGQSVKSYVNSLERVAALRPEHISAYSLIIEEGTPFFERYGVADRQRRRDGADRVHLLPDEEEERRMYELTEEILGQNGYRRYEISNYALPGYECRHNLTYWQRGDYLGFGLGAASLVGNCRFTKSRELSGYEARLRRYQAEGTDRACKSHGSDGGNVQCESLEAETEGFAVEDGFHENIRKLSLSEQMEEYMFLGLRLTAGVSAEEFEKYFHVPLEEVYGEVLTRLEKQGLLARREGRVFLTKRGIDVSNIVLAEFLF